MASHTKTPPEQEDDDLSLMVDGRHYRQMGQEAFRDKIWQKDEF